MDELVFTTRYAFGMALNDFVNAGGSLWKVADSLKSYVEAIVAESSKENEKSKEWEPKDGEAILVQAAPIFLDGKVVAAPGVYSHGKLYVYGNEVIYEKETMKIKPFDESKANKSWED